MVEQRRHAVYGQLRHSAAPHPPQPPPNAPFNIPNPPKALGIASEPKPHAEGRCLSLVHSLDRLFHDCNPHLTCKCRALVEQRRHAVDGQLRHDSEVEAARLTRAPHRLHLQAGGRERVQGKGSFDESVISKGAEGGVV